VEALRAVVRRAAALSCLDVYGGDAIVTPEGRLVLIDLNAWPSFALVRDEAAQHIADQIERRLREQHTRRREGVS
jgi:D-alanine-D-alanine ligase-like ATP-grasp enzyme